LSLQDGEWMRGLFPGSPATMITHDFELSVNHHPRHGSIKLCFTYFTFQFFLEGCHFVMASHLTLLELFLAGAYHI
jgi:hypothetical protein